jgi:hypothetical protein
LLKLEDLQSSGYADLYAQENQLFAGNPFIFDPPDADQMQAAVKSAIDAGDGVVRMRGFLQQTHFASSELRYKGEVFWPDPSGEEYLVQPVVQDAEIIDLIWATLDLDRWGFTTGRGAVLGGDHLSNTHPPEVPLHVYDNPIHYWEHLEDEELASHAAVCLVKPTARALLPAAGHVRVPHWDEVEGLAEEFFEDRPERVSAPQDQEAFDTLVKRGALWERFDDMEAPIPLETQKLTWAHAKAAIKSQRQINSKTGRDGFEEYRGRVCARASDPEVQGAISTWRADPSDENRARARKACRPFSLRDMLLGGSTTPLRLSCAQGVHGPDLGGFERAEWRWKGPMIASGSGWRHKEPDDGPWNLPHRWQREVARKEAAQVRVEPPSTRTPKNRVKNHPLDSVTLGLGVEWRRPGGLLGEMTDWILATSRYPNRPLAVAASLVIISTFCGRRLYTPTGAALNVYVVCLGDTGVGKDRPLKAIPQVFHSCGYNNLHQTAKVFSLSGLEAILSDAPVCAATADEIATNLLARISSKKASSHETVMKGFFQELWSRQLGDAPYKLTRRAVDALTRSTLEKRGCEAVTQIHSPWFSLYGASTPEAFFEALTAGNVKDGFMNRFLLAPADPRPEDANDLEADIPVPKRVIDGLLEIASFGAGNIGGNSFAEASYSSRDSPMVRERRIEWASPAVKERFRAFEKEILKVIDAKPIGYELLGRVVEYTLRLACLHAVSLHGPAHATVDKDNLEWGAAWALESARAMMDGAACMMASTDYEKNLNAVQSVTREAGSILRSEVMRRIRHVNAKELDVIIKHLMEAGLVAERFEAGAGRTGKIYEWIDG